MAASTTVVAKAHMRGDRRTGHAGPGAVPHGQSDLLEGTPCRHRPGGRFGRLSLPVSPQPAPTADRVVTGAMRGLSRPPEPSPTQPRREAPRAGIRSGSRDADRLGDDAAAADRLGESANARIDVVRHIVYRASLRAILVVAGVLRRARPLGLAVRGIRNDGHAAKGPCGGSLARSDVETPPRRGPRSRFRGFRPGRKSLDIAS